MLQVEELFKVFKVTLRISSSKLDVAVLVQYQAKKELVVTPTTEEVALRPEQVTIH